MRNDRDTAVIEIVESHTDDVEMTGGFIRPSEVRINGQALWTPSDRPIRVHEMRFSEKGGDHEAVVQVTLTLFARRVFLGHASESPETPERRIEDARRRLAAAEAELAAAQEAAAA